MKAAAPAESNPSSTPPPDPAAATARPARFADALAPAERRLRWFIVGWITLSTILNLINRNTLAILAPTFSSKFSGVSFTGNSSSAAVIDKICFARDPLSEYLREHFKAAAMTTLASAAGSPQERQSVLIDELNRVVRDVPLYSPERFAGGSLSPQTLRLLSAKPQSAGRHTVLETILLAFQIKAREAEVEHRVQLNRALLHDAYPREIAAIPFEVTDFEYGLIIMAFQLSYAVMYIAGGRFVDRAGEKIGMTACIVWWSVATMCHALARGVLGLGVFRFLLGAGEPGNYPAALRASARWFAKEERGLPIAIWSSGSSIGSLVSVPLIAFLALRFGWQTAFLIPGLLGILWVTVWVLVYRRPSVTVEAERSAAFRPHQTSPQLDAEQNAAFRLPQATSPPRITQNSTPPESFLSLLKQRKVWTITLARLLTDPIWVFYLTWTPKYLAEVWKFNLTTMGVYGWIPFLFGGLGGVLGGVMSDALIRRGLTPGQARKRVLYATGMIAPLGMLTGLAGSAGVSLALIALMAFVCYVWFINTAALMSDIFPENIVGSVLGLAAGAGQFGGLAMALMAGVMLEKNHSYTTLFIIAGSGHLLASIILFLFLKDKPTQINSNLITA